MAYTTIASSTVSGLSTRRQKPPFPTTFESQLKSALEHASRLSEMHGTSHIDTIIAWESVRELLKSHAYFNTLVVSIDTVSSRT